MTDGSDSGIGPEEEMWMYQAFLEHERITEYQADKKAAARRAETMVLAGLNEHHIDVLDLIKGLAELPDGATLGDLTDSIIARLESTDELSDEVESEGAASLTTIAIRAAAIHYLSRDYLHLEEETPEDMRIGSRGKHKSQASILANEDLDPQWKDALFRVSDGLLSGESFAALTEAEQEVLLKEAQEEAAREHLIALARERIVASLEESLAHQVRHDDVSGAISSLTRQVLAQLYANPEWLLLETQATSAILNEKYQIDLDADFVREAISKAIESVEDL